MANADEPLGIPIEGVLDLHTFAPRDVESLVTEYIDACRARGIRHVRIIHGKGIGNLRRIVHAVLSRHPAVVSYRLADESAGTWGATVVELRSVDSRDEDEDAEPG